MSLLDPAERMARGLHNQAELLARTPAEPTTPYEASIRDYVFAEVWARPGLDRRSRFLIAISSAACSSGPTTLLDGYVRGALNLGELTLAELREGALHLAVYAGWTRGGALDASITRAAEELGLEPAAFPPIRGEPWDPDVRRAEGHANFNTVMTFPTADIKTAYLDGGIANFVFGEMWMRPGLDQRARRWITLVGVADSSTDIPIRSHTHAAMASGNATPEEMHEFVLQYAIHGSWPKASVMQSVVFEMAPKVAKGLPWHAPVDGQ